MIVQVATLLLAAAMAQNAPESAWLKAVPAEADVVVRVRSLNGARDDLTAMLRAMSPGLAQQAVPAIEQAIDQFTARFSKPAAESEFLAIARVVPPENPGQYPFAILVHADNHEAILKAVAGDGVERKDEGDGLVSFPGVDGGTWYGAPGPGITAFGPDRALVAAAAKPGEKNLAGTLGDNAAKLLTGDVGLYVNVAALASRYSKEIDAARAQLMNLLDAAGQQAGTARAMGMAKEMYGKLFDGVKVGESLVFRLDFDAAGLDIDGIAAVKPDTDAARELAATSPPRGYETLAKLPAASSYFLHMDLDAATLTRMQNLGLSMMFPDGKPSPEMQKALDSLKALGRLQTDTATGFGDGFEVIAITRTENPEKMIEASLANSRAMKADQAGEFNFIKSAEVNDKAETYRDIPFSHSRVTFDLDKLAAMSGPTGNRAMLEAMFGGDTLQTWYGIHDGAVLSVISKDWDTAKARVDSYLDGKGSLGETASYKEITAKLPKTATLVGFLSAQGLVKQLSSQFAGMLQNPNLKPPGDLPAEPVLMGGAIQPVRNGYTFRGVIPSAVVPILEKGLAPALQGMRGVQGQ